MEQQFPTDSPIRSYTMLPSQALHHPYPAHQQSPPQSQHQQQQTYHQHHQQVTVQPVPIPQKSAHANTFVHKLYNMVVDNQFQHLIAWNYTGASFIVCNIMEFARDVLPKHFKHNNFSSFVRQLNMYGFHKVNKSPRGHRTLAENQIWEFSHSKFLRDRPDLLDDIKRKTMESDTVRRETGDLHAHMAMMQVSQSDMLQQINHLYDNFGQIVKELHETRQKQESHRKLVKTVMQYITQQNGGQLPHELDLEYKKLDLENNEMDAPPSIFVTTHDQPTQPQPQPQPQSQSQPQSQQQVPSQRQRINNNNSLMPSPTFRSNLPPSPSPTMLLSSSDDDANSYYSTSNTNPNNNNANPQQRALSTENILNSPTNTRQPNNPFSFINNNSTMSG
ncbi:HSF-type DNA-binding-domain-containing protein [Thamnidium elegans]|nr:HSF-type DNA-binding-domain-containing protein [Thamnidium elegans]